jgi:cysteine desulfurase/selenocysteine lyase
MNDEKFPETIRADFPNLKRLRNSKPPIYFDNACTTLVPQQVIDSLNEYYSAFPACGGSRGRYWFTEEVVRRIEGDFKNGIKGSRAMIRDFINARSEKEIIFTQNASHAINMVALGFRFRPGDVVLLTDKEHNSNLVPWLRLQNKGIIKVDHVEPRQDGEFDLEAFKDKLKNNRVPLVSMAYTSNLTGYTIPAKEIIDLAHSHETMVLLDGAQAVPHMSVDVQDLDVDFLAFSIHKMCGPKGVGVLYGKKERLGWQQHEEDGGLDCIEPAMLGGDTVKDTTYENYELAEPPARFEMGVQNYPGQIAAGVTIQYLQKIGMDCISTQCGRLAGFLTKELLDSYGDTGWFKILGSKNGHQRSGILTFEVKRPNAFGIADELNKRNNIMIRDGVFCVHSYLNKEFGVGWTRPRPPSEHRMVYRVSIYFYNTLEECQMFLDTLENIFEERSYI